MKAAQVLTMSRPASNPLPKPLFDDSLEARALFVENFDAERLNRLVK